MNYDEDGPDPSCDHGHGADERHAEEAAYRATCPGRFPVAYCPPEAWEHEFYHYERLRRAAHHPAPAGYART